MRASIIGCILAVAFTCTAASGQEPSVPPPLKPEEIQQLVAPIALYPDDLLSQVLIASTYPLEVVAADRWVKTNAKLDSETRKADLQKQNWDTSIKSLTTTPTVLATMSERLDWSAEAGRRRAGAADRRDGRRAGSALQGSRRKNITDNRAADCGNAYSGKRAGHHHPVGVAANRLCSHL